MYPRPPRNGLSCPDGNGASNEIPVPPSRPQRPPVAPCGLLRRAPRSRLGHRPPRAGAHPGAGRAGETPGEDPRGEARLAGRPHCPVPRSAARPDAGRLDLPARGHPAPAVDAEEQGPEGQGPGGRGREAAVGSEHPVDGGVPRSGEAARRRHPVDHGSRQRLPRSAVRRHGRRAADAEEGPGDRGARDLGAAGGRDEGHRAEDRHRRGAGEPGDHLRAELQPGGRLRAAALLPVSTHLLPTSRGLLGGRGHHLRGRPGDRRQVGWRLLRLRLGPEQHQHQREQQLQPQRQHQRRREQQLAAQLPAPWRRALLEQGDGEQVWRLDPGWFPIRQRGRLGEQSRRRGRGRGQRQQSLRRRSGRSRRSGRGQRQQSRPAPAWGRGGGYGGAGGASASNRASPSPSAGGGASRSSGGYGGSSGGYGGSSGGFGGGSGGYSGSSAAASSSRGASSMSYGGGSRGGGGGGRGGGGRR